MTLKTALPKCGKDIEYDCDTDIAVQRRESLMIGIQHGKSPGIAEGGARGFRQAKLETAKNFLQFVLSVENISRATGLTKAEFEALR